jgi:hypothetical protein
MTAATRSWESVTSAKTDMMKVKNVSGHVLRFVLLNEGHEGPHRNVPAVELDTSRTVTGPNNEMVHPPRLFNGGKNVRQLREMRVEIGVGETLEMPIKFLSAILRVECDACRGPGNERAACKYPGDQEHRATWRIAGSGLLGINQVEVDMLANVPLDGTTRIELEENAKATRDNFWGNPHKVR